MFFRVSCEMDSSYHHGFQYNFPSMADPNLSTPNTAMAPPTQTIRMCAGTNTEGESSFNDSGYFSSPQASHFTALSDQLQGSNVAHQSVSYGHSPAKTQGSIVGDLMGPPAKTQGSIAGDLMGTPARTQGSVVGSLMGAPRPSWQEDFPNVNDEWDRNFINNFEEHLFGFDASDLNTMVEGILGSPFKSPSGSPFSSPHRGRSAAAGLGLSPFKNLSTSNIMLAGPKRSPAPSGGSPFKSPFSSPSPVRGLNSHTRSSPLTRQRRLILQSPAHRSEGSADQFQDLPEFLDNIKEESGDDLGVVPFQRTNSFGFTPHDDISSSPPFSSLYGSSPLQPLQPITADQNLQQIACSVTPVRQQKRIKTENLYNLRSSPAKNENFSYKQRSPSNTKPPTRLAQGRISVTQHNQLINELPPKDALRLVRAHFKEVLERASAEAVIKETKLKSKMKPGAKKPQLYPEISQALSKPAPDTQSYTGVYTRIQNHRPSGRRRQEILPKPTPDWPRREPCKIAPKKRKR